MAERGVVRGNSCKSIAWLCSVHQRLNHTVQMVLVCPCDSFGQNLKEWFRVLPDPVQIWHIYMFLFDLPTRHTHPHMICPPDIQSWKFRNTCDVFTLCLLFPALCSLCSALFLRREVWGELHLEWRGERLVMVMRVVLPVMVVSWVNTAKIFDSWKFESGSDDDKF